MNGQVTTQSGEDNGRKKIFIIAGCILLLILIGVLLALFLPKNLKAIDIRIQRLVGVVNLYDDKGKDISLLERMRLNSGQTLTTADESLVMLSLDETKLVTLEAESKAKIHTAGKALEFELTEGNLFFNVTEKLSDDSTYDIRTSTMLCGIRGTSGYAGKDVSGHDVLMVSDGEVVVTGVNPITKEETQTAVGAGNMVTVYLDDEAEGDSTVSFNTRPFREEDLPPLALDAIRKDEDLQKRIEEATGFSAEKIVELAKVTSREGQSMFGDAITELQQAGIEDAIPLMGFPAQEITIVANKAADTAEDDLALEIAIIKGMDDVLEAGLEGGCDKEELDKIMKDATDEVCKILIEAEGLGVSGDGLIEISDSMTGSYAEALSEMKRTDLSSDEIFAVVGAIGTVYDNTMDRARKDGLSGSDVVGSINGASNHITTTVHNEMEKLATGDETVIALLGEGEDDDTAEAVKVADDDSKKQDADDTDTANAVGAQGANDNGNSNTGHTVNRSFVPGLLEPGIEPDVSDYVDKIDPQTGKLTLTDGTIFDPVYYAAANPDAYNKYGYNTNDLLYDYLHRKNSGETLYASAEDKKAAEDKAFKEFAKMLDDDYKAKQEAEAAMMVASAEEPANGGGNGGGGGGGGVSSGTYDPQNGGYGHLSDGTSFYYTAAQGAAPRLYTNGPTTMSLPLSLDDGNGGGATLTSMTEFDWNSTANNTSVVNGNGYTATKDTQGDFVLKDPNGQVIITETDYGVFETYLAQNGY